MGPQRQLASRRGETLSVGSSSSYQVLSRPEAIILLCDSGELLVCPDGRILKFPGLLSGWRRSVPLELPGESFEKRPCHDTHGSAGEFGILTGGFGESQAI